MITKGIRQRPIAKESIFVASLIMGERTQRRKGSCLNCLIAVISFCGIVEKTGAELTGAKDPKAYTTAQFVKDVEEYNRQTVVEAYRRVGQRSPKWDEPAFRLLEALARYFTTGAGGMIHRPKDVPTQKNLIELGQAAERAGCQDPLVLYALAVAYADSNDTRARQYILAAWAGMKSSKYPSKRIIAAGNRAKTCIPDRERPELEQILRERHIDLACGEFVNDAHRRLMLDELFEIPKEHDKGARREQVREQLALRKDADPWISNVFAGRCFIDAAWLARGGDVAANVTEEGWKGFREQLENARRVLVKAHELKPHLPEAASQMITVAMGDRDRHNETPRMWFEKSIAAQLDYAPAYDALLWAMRPRWGGSYRQMLDFGFECYQSGRFDTSVPSYFLVAVEKIAEDAQDVRVWQTPQVHDAAVKILEQYVERTKDEPAVADEFRSYHAAIEWRIGDFEKARLALSGVTQVSEDAFARLGAPGAMAVSEIFAHTGAGKDKMISGQKHERAKRYKEAAEAYAGALKAMPADDPGVAFATASKTLADWQVAFDAGQWVNILPKPGFVGWSIENGDVTFSDDGTSIALVANGVVATILCDAPFGRRYELEAVIDLSTGGKNPGGRILTEYMGEIFYANVLTVVRDGQVFARRFGVRNAHRERLQPADSIRVKIQLWDGACLTSINGKTLSDVPQAPATDEERVGRIGLSGYLQNAGAKVVFKELKIRKLTERPERSAAAVP